MGSITRVPFEEICAFHTAANGAQSRTVGYACGCCKHCAEINEGDLFVACRRKNGADNVVQFRTATNPDDVLGRAVGEFESVIVLGYDKDGALVVKASTNITHERALWLVSRFKNTLLNDRYQK